MIPSQWLLSLSKPIEDNVSTQADAGTAMGFFERMWETIKNFFIGDGIVDYSLRIVGSILIVIVAHYLIKLINFIVMKSLYTSKKRREKAEAKGKKLKNPVDISLVYFIQALIKFVIYFIAVIVIIAIFGLNITSFGTIVAGAVAGISLSLQDVISSFAYGVILITSKEFKIGDSVTLANGVQGTIRRLDILNTILVTTDKSVVYIPNNVVGKSAIINVSAEPIRYLLINFTIPNNTPLKQVRELLLKEALATPKSLKKPEPIFVITGFNEESIAVSLRVFCANQDYWTVAFDLNDRIYKAFQDNNLLIGKGNVNVLLANPAEVNSMKVAEQAKVLPDQK